jgi:glyoxylase-like metal-dependent hydrolase (beta-lactamase superfamily II)
MMGGPIELGEGVWQYQTSLWQANSVLVVADGHTIVCDPNWQPSEIETIREEALRAGGATHFLVTHTDCDHVCGIGFFPDAVVVAGRETAERIRSGAAAEGLAEAAEEWGVSWPLELRVDKVVEPSTFAAGEIRIEAIEARGHVDNGVAYVLLDQGVLLPGDYLLDMAYPFAMDSVERSRRTYERLLDAIDRTDLRWIIPGHGRALTPPEAVRVGQEDLAYLERLADAAHQARRDRLSPGHALVAVFSAAEPPRQAPPDFEVFELHLTNVRAALADQYAREA